MSIDRKIVIYISVKERHVPMVLEAVEVIRGLKKYEEETLEDPFCDTLDEMELAARQKYLSVQCSSKQVHQILSGALDDCSLCYWSCNHINAGQALDGVVQVEVTAESDTDSIWERLAGELARADWSGVPSTLSYANIDEVPEGYSEVITKDATVIFNSESMADRYIDLIEQRSKLTAPAPSVAGLLQEIEALPADGKVARLAEALSTLALLVGDDATQAVFAARFGVPFAHDATQSANYAGEPDTDSTMAMPQP